LASRVLAALAIAFVLVACGGGGGGKKAAPCPAVETVDTKDAVNFAPKCATIPAGSTIKWRNTDGVPHTVTFTTGEAFDKYFEKDQTVSRTFATAGTFAYYCKVHGKVMSGKIVVTAVQ
jgi:plastocyanin